MPSAQQRARAPGNRYQLVERRDRAHPDRRRRRGSRAGRYPRPDAKVVKHGPPLTVRIIGAKLNRHEAETRYHVGCGRAIKRTAPQKRKTRVMRDDVAGDNHGDGHGRSLLRVVCKR